jgi:glycosyltransferase involved in cell wall biosynthesis
LRILQVSTFDVGGGAAKVAWNLFHTYQAYGHSAWLAVGSQKTCTPQVLPIAHETYRDGWARLWTGIGSLLSPLRSRVRGAGRVYNLLTYYIGQPRRWLEVWRGYEDFHFPASWHLLDLPPERPDIVHCHNLHGDYFDLGALPWLSQQVPVVLTLHDAWLLSGHCAHSFDCERWQTGCGQCPDLTISPAIRRDATAYNWRRKRDIYARSRLYVATPCQWLMRKVEQSILAPAIVEARVIPYGVDLSVFHPADRQATRVALSIAPDARVMLFTANGIRLNIWKDYQTMRAAVALLAKRCHGQDILFLALGEDAPAERIGRVEVRFVPYQQEPETVARYYQAADIYVHAARADTFPNTVLEALACGTPVVATAVGGIPEQVKGLGVANGAMCKTTFGLWDVDEATGVLVTPGDAQGIATAIEFLLSDDALRRQIGANAAQDARKRFDLERQAQAYLAWYQAIVAQQNVECAGIQHTNILRGPSALSNPE